MGTVSPSSSRRSIAHGAIVAAATEEDAIRMEEEDEDDENLVLLSDSLKDLRNLRSQLYSAAEYFETFYKSNSQKPGVLRSLKDYTVEALISTVDHLGFVSYKVNDIIGEKSEEVTEAELRFLCVEQRVRNCRESIDAEGRSQQSLVINAPKFHKHYILPGGSVTDPVARPAAKFAHHHRSSKQRSQQKLRDVASVPVCGESTPRMTRSPSLPSLPPQPGIHKCPSSPPPAKLQALKFSQREKRAASPARSPNPFTRSTSMSMGPDMSDERYPQSPQAPLHSQSVKGGGGDGGRKEERRSLSRSKSFLRSLLMRRSWRHDESLYSYLDEY